MAAMMAGVLTTTGLTSGGTGPAKQDWPVIWMALGTCPLTRQTPAITPQNAPDLVDKWHFGVGQNFLAVPVVADGSVYIGSPAGWFYKLNETTGAVEAKAFIGFQAGGGNCKPLGVIDTATVAVDPSDGDLTVYVGGPDGYLYAFKASNLALRWKAVVALPLQGGHTFFDWSSPTVSHSRIYIGVASYCNVPFIRGEVISYDQATGKQLGSFYSVPAGQRRRLGLVKRRGRRRRLCLRVYRRTGPTPILSSATRSRLSSWRRRRFATSARSRCRRPR